MRKLLLFVGVVAVAALILAGMAFAPGQAQTSSNKQAVASQAVGGALPSSSQTPPSSTVSQGPTSHQTGNQTANVCTGYQSGPSKANSYQPFAVSSGALSCYETHISP